MTTSGHWTGSSPEDELLSGLYQQVTGQQAARFAAGYDVAAGLDRYRAWLREHAAEDPAELEAIQASMVMAVQASAGGTGAVTAAQDPGEAVTADRTTREPAGTRSPIARSRAGWDADRAVTALYRTHYRSLVGLAVLLVRDIATAEDLVQDSFVAMHSAWPRLADSDLALSYLRQSVVNRSRTVLRHRMVVDRNVPKPAPDMPGGEQEDIRKLERLRADIGAADAARPAARGPGAALLRRSVGGPDRLSDGHQQRCGQEPRRPGDVVAASRIDRDGRMTQRHEAGHGGHQHPQSNRPDGHPRPELDLAPPLAKGRYLDHRTTPNIAKDPSYRSGPWVMRSTAEL